MTNVETMTKPEIQTKPRPPARTSSFIIRHSVAVNAITIRNVSMSVLQQGLEE
jgi:hypothetical protein